jgi:hypothetical protein
LYGFAAPETPNLALHTHEVGATQALIEAYEYCSKFYAKRGSKLSVQVIVASAATLGRLFDSEAAAERVRQSSITERMLYNLNEWPQLSHHSSEALQLLQKIMLTGNHKRTVEDVVGTLHAVRDDSGMHTRQWHAYTHLSFKKTNCELCKSVHLSMSHNHPHSNSHCPSSYSSGDYVHVLRRPQAHGA